MNDVDDRQSRPGVPSPAKGTALAGAAIRLPSLRPWSVRLILAGCPRCRGTLEHCLDLGPGGSRELYWQCINCGRSYAARRPEDEHTTDTSAA